MSIEIKNLSYIYLPGTPYEKKALNQINLSIKAGEFIGLIGHTGSGKSTLAQHFNGLLKPSSGSIEVERRNLWAGKKPPKDICGKVGLVFQYPEYQLFAETVYEDVAFGPLNLGFPLRNIAEIVQHALESVGLDYLLFKDKSPFSLSGGEKRRVAIAGVMAMNPDILVLDEPTAGLDPVGRKEIIRLIHHFFQQKGKTVIWISHNMDEIARLVNRLIVMVQGKILMDGSPQEVFSREKELMEVGLAIPAASSLVRRLKEQGKPIPGKAITVDQAFQEIAMWLEGGVK
ncbi:energy-coupling factor transporter ATPase [Dehalobacterium formicoaceticum]|uniref:Energy-coupling factor transporter ATP-binding protein EcfA2 n=1 Tax=Dehalobacterium formicoaceticum TaxID=51515 RepID=A0ABT1Y2R3_9FIRM|nr:energy-coupling factor transporter ATPase [Dehalobacterium formicoaceticum]MCR6543986.1 energy-coupling factor transporter ATPase [Dehalobacterium formicoaceticum]